MRDHTSLPTEWKPSGIWDRFLAWLGRRHVNQQWVQIVYRDRKFERIAGPHYFWMKRGERLGNQIYLGLRFAKLELNNLSSFESARIGLKVSISYRFDPRTIGQAQPITPDKLEDMRYSLIHLPDHFFTKIIDGAVLPLFRRILPKYRIPEIQQGVVFDEIEARVKHDLAANLGLQQFGIQIGNVQIEDRIMPEKVDSELLRSAGRQIVRDDLNKAGPQELALVGLLQMLDNATGSGGETYYASDPISTLQTFVEKTTPQVRVVESSTVASTASAAPPKPAASPKPADFDTPPTGSAPTEDSFGD